MKKLAMACLLALPALALVQPEASAWFRFGLGASLNTNLEGSIFGNKNWSMTCTQVPCYPACYPPPPHHERGPAPQPVPERVKPAAFFESQPVRASYWFED